jgi:hypothetical protein
VRLGDAGRHAVDQLGTEIGKKRHHVAGDAAQPQHVVVATPDEQSATLGPGGLDLTWLRPLPLVEAAIPLGGLAASRVDAGETARRQQANGLGGDQVTQSLAFA